MNPIFGGFFTAGCVAVFPFILFFYLKDIWVFGFGKSFVGWLYLAFLLWFSGQVLLHWDVSSLDITSSHAAYIFKFLVLFMIARLIDPTSKSFSRWVVLFFFLTTGIILRQALDGNLLLAEISRQENPDFQLDYQGVGHAVLILAIFCAPLIKWRSLVYLFAILALFLSGARSELVALIFAASLVELCKTRSPALIISLISLLLPVLFILLQWVELPDHRVFNIFRPAADASVQERSVQIADALNTIQSNPLTGAYASYAGGNYAHNILSAWVDLGLLGFIFLIFVLIVPFGKLVFQFNSMRKQPLYVITLVIFSISILLLTFAKSFTYQSVPLAIGLYCRLRALK